VRTTVAVEPRAVDGVTVRTMVDVVPRLDVSTGKKLVSVVSVPAPAPSNDPAVVVSVVGPPPVWNP
jgi:hypothetical protein